MMRGTVPLLLASSLHAAVIGTAVRWHAAGTDQAFEHGPAAHVAVGSPIAVKLTSLQMSAPRQATPAHSRAIPVAATPEPEPDATAAPDQQPAFEPPVALPTEPMPEPSQETAGEEMGAASFTAAPELYLPRNELSQAPRALSLIDIGFPSDTPLKERLEAVLAIYIDELGQVRKVEAVRGDLPPALLESARNAFLSAQFQAGEQQGRAVKSFIHVAVVFDETPVDTVAASRALPMR